MAEFRHMADTEDVAVKAINEVPLALKEKATRFNNGKPEMSEILKFGSALVDVATVMEMGAIKYEVGNWLKGGKPDKEYLDSAMRHLMAHISGELYDQELGTKHLANAAWNLLAALLLAEELQGAALDPEFDLGNYIEKYS